MANELNIDIIKKSIKEIYKKTLKDCKYEKTTPDLINDDEFILQLFFNVINSCMRYQYALLKDNLYSRAIENQKLKNIEGIELFNHYYKHQFTHCYTAFIDEYFETDDAKDFLIKSFYNDGVPFKIQSDVIEEAIDLFHFILQFGVMIIELDCVKKLLKNNDVDISFNVENLDKYLKNEKLVEYMKSSIDLFSSNIASRFNNIYLTNSKRNILYEARNLIRKINYKDWKTYKNDHYDDVNISLIKHNITDIFLIFFNGFIKDCVNEIIKAKNNKTTFFWNNIFDVEDNKNLNIIEILLLVYGIYIAKNYVNIERQKNGY